MSVKDVTQFRNIGIAGIAIGETRVPKTPGDSFQVSFQYEHKGSGGTFDIGVGFCPAATAPLTNNVETGGWFAGWVTVPPSVNWTVGPIASISGVIPLSMPLGLKDIRPFIQTQGGLRDPGGQGFLVAGYDRIVYDIKLLATSFQNLYASYA